MSAMYLATATEKFHERVRSIRRYICLNRACYRDDLTSCSLSLRHEESGHSIYSAKYLKCDSTKRYFERVSNSTFTRENLSMPNTRNMKIVRKR